MRHRTTPPPAQKTPQSSPQRTQDSDSDDDYGGVDDISGSEEDEPNVEVAEERAIISSEGEDVPKVPRPYEEYGQWEGFEFNPADTASLDGNFFEQEMQKSSSIDESYDEAVAEKHVHWESPQESDSETIGSDNGAEWYGDLFMDKNELDPGFLRQIEKDDDNGQFSDDGFFYGEADTDEDVDELAESSDESDSSGYDCG